ncbi:MAG TPA: hypothetical protein VGR35_17650 [Tepidisphaeraceae bacterium]|nr:hypothetical protein [Tepidisphaeraceae bacterium]
MSSTAWKRRPRVQGGFFACHFRDARNNPPHFCVLEPEESITHAIESNPTRNRRRGTMSFRRVRPHLAPRLTRPGAFRRVVFRLLLPVSSIRAPLRIRGGSPAPAVGERHDYVTSHHQCPDQLIVLFQHSAVSD